MFIIATVIKNVVSIPAHTVRVPSGKYVYIYLTKKTYRSSDGGVRNERICIGKLTDDGKMIPNLNYYEQYKLNSPQNLPDVIRSCGTYAVCREISKRLELDDLLMNVFPDSFKKIMSIAHYFLTYGNVLYYFNDWLDDTVSFTPDAMDDIAAGRVLKAITDEDRQSFLRFWLAKYNSKEFVAYDVTSISTYSEKLQDAEYGYNRDKDDLPQLNYGMYYNESTRIPLYYQVYPGSITDKTHCSSMIEGTKSLDFEKIYFVMDKGFFTEENLKYITSSGNRFMMPIPPSNNLFKELVNKHFDDVVYNLDNKMDGRELHCKKVESNAFGFRMNVHLYYNPSKVPSDIAVFHEKMRNMEDTIKDMEILPSKNSIYFRYFNIEKKDGKIVYSKREDKIKEAIKRCGFFAIAETVFSKTSNEVLAIYSERDSIEKCFDDLKNGLDFERIHCSNAEILRGKMFASFIALIYMSQIRNTLRDYMLTKKFTMKKIFLELDKIKVAYDSKKEEGYRLLNPLTKTQREILEKLSMDETIFTNFI